MNINQEIDGQLKDIITLKELFWKVFFNFLK